MTKNVTLYMFPGISSEEARIEGDRSVEDITCPYCVQSDCCNHLLACIDPLNYDVGGKFHGLDEEFSYRISAVFLPHLRKAGEDPNWKSSEVSELWACAAGSWSTDDEEIEIDYIVMFGLISDLLEKHAAYSVFGSQLEGIMGTETEYTMIYDDQPQKVLNQTIEELDRLLITKTAC